MWYLDEDVASNFAQYLEDPYSDFGKTFAQTHNIVNKSFTVSNIRFCFLDGVRRECANIKGTVLEVIQKLMCLYDKHSNRCRKVSKSKLNIIAFLMHHIHEEGSNGTLLQYFIVKTSDYLNNKSLLKSILKESFNSVLEYICEQISNDEFLFTYLKEEIPEKVLNDILNKNWKELLIKDVLYIDGRKLSKDKFLSIYPDQHQDILLSYLKDQFKYLVDASEGLGAVFDKMYDCDPVHCTIVKEDDDVLGDPFESYTMDKVNSIFNIAGYCFSIPYLASAVIGTRGRIQTILKGAPFNTNIKIDMINGLANYYTLNLNEFHNDVEMLVTSFTETEFNILGNKLNINKNTNNSLNIFEQLKKFFTFMLDDFQVLYSMKGMKSIYIATNGLILDIIGYVGYICLSDNITANATSTVRFECAEHALRLLLEFISKDLKDYKDVLKDFSANGDNLKRIIEDIPNTCIHGIGFRLLSFYIACHSMSIKLLDSIKKDLVYVIDNDDDTAYDIVNDLCKPASFLHPIFDKNTGKFSYYSCVFNEFSENVLPNARYYYVNQFKHDGSCGRWIAINNSTKMYTKPKSRVSYRELFDVHDSGQVFVQNVRDKEIINQTFIDDNFENILNIAENVQFDRKVLISALINHTRNVMRLVKTNSIEIDFYESSILYRNIFSFTVDNKTVYRDIETMAKSQYSMNNTNVIIQNTYRVYDNIINYSHDARLLNRMFSTIPQQNQYLDRLILKLNSLNEINKSVKYLSNLLEQAFSTMHNVSHNTPIAILKDARLDIDRVNVIHGDLRSIKQLRDLGESNDDVKYKSGITLLADTMQYCNSENVVLYVNKLNQFLINDQIHAISIHIQNLRDILCVRMLKISYCSRQLLLHYHTYTDVVSDLISNRNHVLTTIEKECKLEEIDKLMQYVQTTITNSNLLDICKIYYYSVFWFWYSIIQIHSDPTYTTQSTVHFRMDKITEDYKLLSLFSKSLKQDEKNNVGFLGNDKLSNYYKESFDFLRNKYEYYKDTLQLGDRQESIPIRTRFMMKVLVAEYMSTISLSYNLFKETIIENIDMNKNELLTAVKRSLGY